MKLFVSVILAMVLCGASAFSAEGKLVFTLKNGKLTMRVVDLNSRSHHKKRQRRTVVPVVTRSRPAQVRQVVTTIRVVRRSGSSILVKEKKTRIKTTHVVRSVAIPVKTRHRPRFHHRTRSRYQPRVARHRERGCSRDDLYPRKRHRDRGVRPGQVADGLGFRAYVKF
jgi:hypothetical protein